MITESECVVTCVGANISDRSISYDLYDCYHNVTAGGSQICDYQCQLPHTANINTFNATPARIFNDLIVPGIRMADMSDADLLVGSELHLLIN